MSEDKVFLVRKGETIERLEPKFYLSKYRENQKRVSGSKFEIYSLSQVTLLISDGTHFTPKYVEDGVKFLSVKDVRRFEITYNDSKFISNEEADLLDRRCKPQKEDVLLTKIGTYGFAASVNSMERFQIFVSLALLRPDLGMVSSEFLALCLNESIVYTQFERLIKGAGVPDLHLEDIRKVKIPVPCLDRQIEIVNFFEVAYKNKKSKELEAKKLLNSIDDYLLAELGMFEKEEEDNGFGKLFFLRKYSEITGGRIDASYNSLKYKSFEDKLLSVKSVRLGCLLDIITKGETPLEKGDFSCENNIPFIRVNNIGETELLGDFEYIPKVTHERMFRSKLFGGEILYSMAGSIGRCILYPEKAGEANINQAIAKIKLKNNFSDFKSFVVEILNSVICKKQSLRSLTVSAQPNINFEQIKALLIPVPPIEKQNEIVAHIAGIREQAKRLREEAAQELEQAKREVEAMILGEDV